MSIGFSPDFTLSHAADFALGTTIASNTTTDGTAADTNVYEGPVHCYFVLGDCGDATTVITLSLIQCATSGGSYSAITGATTTLTAGSTVNDNTVVVVRADNYSMRYIKARVVTASGSVISCPVYAHFFAKRKITVGSGVQTS